MTPDKPTSGLRLELIVLAAIAGATLIALGAGLRVGLDPIALLLGLSALCACAFGYWQLRRGDAEAERARAADLSKSRFLAVASHDLRQPLQAIGLYSSALLRRVEGGEAAEIVGKLDRAAAQLSTMVTQLFDFAKLQSGSVQPTLEDFPLQDVLDGIAKDGVTVAATPLSVRTDIVLLERALQHLVANARTHGGGQVRVDVAALGDKAEIAVIDHGPGIAAEDQARVFDEFVRLDSRARGDGFGLGLTAVREIAKLLGLELELRSTPGQGAAFLLRVPLAASGTSA